MGCCGRPPYNPLFVKNLVNRLDQLQQPRAIQEKTAAQEVAVQFQNSLSEGCGCSCRDLSFVTRPLRTLWNEQQIARLHKFLTEKKKEAEKSGISPPHELAEEILALGVEG